MQDKTSTYTWILERSAVADIGADMQHIQRHNWVKEWAK